MATLILHSNVCGICRAMNHHIKAVRTGVGAEEQPARYSHHRVCLQTHRRPFLNENVVSFLNFLPVWEKANLTLPCGIGEKPILCLQARQSGSRIAKIEKKNEKPSDKCGRRQVISLENLSIEN
ncbi:hypothetical protein FD755_010497 [Muntiacus reevesi]|uniref:Uncharacterized protein n=1 Tax=Muntiacus reevesi TaxID=9886 RepID=A0A5N3XYA9_MUNRE|nr:hypothetical protein FD755_010497 [Muntiacus reevesi]